MEPTKEDLSDLFVATARAAYDHMPKWLADELAEATLAHLDELLKAHRKKLNVVHFYHCAVWRSGNGPDDCNCGSTTTVDEQGVVTIERPR